MIKKIQILFAFLDKNEVESLVEILNQSEYQIFYDLVTQIETLSLNLKQINWELLIIGYGSMEQERINKLLESPANKLPYIYMSENSDEEVTVHAIKSGASDFISNNVNNRLLKTINYILYHKDSNLAIESANSSISNSDVQAIENMNTMIETQKELKLLKAKFISLISRELRTPLTNIMLSTDLLKNYGEICSNEERNKYLAKIQDTVLQMIKLMENVQIVGKIDTEHYVPHSDLIDIDVFCRSISDNIEFNYDRKKIVDVEVITPQKMIMNDETLLSLIISNTLSNAVKFSAKDDKIVFKTYIDENNIKFSFIDKGIGIPEDDIPQVFSMFYRASNTGSIQGYGLGLTIVKHCIEFYKGSIQIESQQNQGTTVNITLPIIKEY